MIASTAFAEAGLVKVVLYKCMFNTGLTFIGYLTNTEVRHENTEEIIPTQALGLPHPWA